MRSGVTLVEVMVVVVILFIIGGVGFGGCYGITHSKTVEGKVESIENLTPTGIRGGTDGGVKYSFAVSIETDDEIFSFSAEDRQWGTVKVGDKVKARAYPYAPWSFGKAGTYYGGRLMKKYKK